MKLFFLLLFVFCPPAYAGCVDTDCPKKQDGTWKIQHFGDCPDEGCTRTKHHKFDPELNKLKNIRSDDQQPVLRSIRWMKGLPDPTNLTECGNRDELKQLGEGQKITVVAWALTAKKELQTNAAHHQKQIDALSAALQKVSAQLELSKAAPQTVLNNQ